MLSDIFTGFTSGLGFWLAALAVYVGAYFAHEHLGAALSGLSLLGHKATPAPSAALAEKALTK